MHSCMRRLLSTTYLGVTLVCFTGQTVLANPIDGVVAAGSATISSAGSTLTVQQNSAKVVIDWRGFDIAAGEHTQFVQPDSSSIALNRVNSNSASRIDGKLTANGNVIIVNQNGVMFGATAQVDVNGLVATTADIDNDQFMNGSGALAFNKAGVANASIINQGSITAKDAGLVGLVAPNVENSGVIAAKLGKVQLAAGETMTLDMYGDGLLNVAVRDGTPLRVLNKGTIQADGGAVLITAADGANLVNSLISVGGNVRAQSVGAKNGRITIQAKGSNKTTKQGSSNVVVSGILDASGRDAGERGGTISVTGDNVALLAGTVIDASGYIGLSGTTTGLVKSAKREGSAGGEILIGGDYLGQGDMQTAKNLYVDAGALILNDSLFEGDAGRTIFWSDNNTAFYGNVYARSLGGKQVDAGTWHATLGGNTGDGGFVETSGHNHLDAGGYVDLTASNGARGTYFLDPTDITIYGNVDPTFISTDGMLNLSSSLRGWTDVSDTARVILTYSTDSLGGATVTGTSGTNTITTSADVSANLAVGARIRLGGAGTTTTASTLGADTYTITAINGTTITLSSNLTQNYNASALYRGLVSQVTDKSSVGNNYTAAAAAQMPLWISNAQNGNAIALFDGTSDYLYSAFNLGGSNLSGFHALNSLTATGSQGSYPMFWTYGHSEVEFRMFGATGNPEITDSNNLARFGTNMVNTNMIMSGVLNDTTNIGELWVNGVGGTQTGTGVALPNSDHSYIGSRSGVFIANMNYMESIVYNTALPETSRHLVEQYQSAKWGIGLTPPGTGATEVAKATAADGYSVFTTRYLERLSQSADISLQATNNINFDLKGDNLSLQSGRNFTLTAGNDILSASAGTVTLSGAGALLLSAGRDINFDDALNFVTDSGDATFHANNSIFFTGGGDITTRNAGAISGGNIILNADRDASLAGRISLGASTAIASNGGNITMGGGSGVISAGTGFAYGTDATNGNGSGIAFTATTTSVNSGGGSFIMNGEAASGAGLYGVVINGTAASGAGNMTIYGNRANGGGATLTNQYGVYVLTNGTLSSTSGDISIFGNASTAGNSTATGAIGGPGSVVSTSGNLNFTGTNATNGLYLQFANLTTGGSGNINLTGSGTTAIRWGSSGTQSAGGNFVVNSAVALDADIVISAGNNISFASTVDSRNATARDLMLTATTGTISFGGAVGATNKLDAFSVTSGASMTVPAVRANTIFARTTTAGADITLGGIQNAQGTSGTTATYVSGDNFFNPSSFAISTAGTGRWLVYSERPADNTPGGLTPDFNRYSCTYGGSCPSFGATGNGMLYSYTPTLTVTPNGGIALSFADAVPNLTNYAYTLSGYLGSDASTDSVTGSLNASTNYTQFGPAGTYSINYLAGSLASTLGYGFSYGNNAAAITVTGSSATFLPGSVQREVQWPTQPTIDLKFTRSPSISIPTPPAVPLVIMPELIQPVMSVGAQGSISLMPKTQHVPKRAVDKKGEHHIPIDMSRTNQRIRIRQGVMTMVDHSDLGSLYSS